MRVLCLLLVTLTVAPLPVFAGDCRTELRPLLGNLSPDPAALDSVRTVCRTEADAGDADALYQLALFHLGLAGEWRPEAAIPMIQDAAGRGVSEAQYWLAWQYEAGPLLPNDTAIALGWYQRAANANHRLAIARLAQAYERGELGLHRDLMQAAAFKARQAQCMNRESSR